MSGYPVILGGDHAAFEAEHANTPPHERPDWPLPSFDARDWAKAFLDAYEKYEGLDFLSEGVVTSWFANALMRGYDEHAAHLSESEVVNDLRRALSIVKAERDHWRALVPRADRVQFPFDIKTAETSD